MADAKKKIDVEFAGEFIRARMVEYDSSTGYDKPVAGLHIRMRIATINTWHVIEDGVLCIHQSRDEPVQVVGSLDAMDKIMARVGLKEVP